MPYLEISSRQSGKSTRLLDKVFETISINPVARPTVFAANSVVTKNLKGRYEDKYGPCKLIKFAFIDNGNGMRGRSGPYFFDEFEFYKGDDWFKNIPPHELESAYFCTTAKSMRTLKSILDINNQDILCQLIRRNNGNYERFDGLNTSKATMANQFANLSLQQFNLDIVGNFIR